MTGPGTTGCTCAQITNQSKGLLTVNTVIRMNVCKLMVFVGEHLHTEVYQVWIVNWNTTLITLQEHNNAVITSGKDAPYNNIQRIS